MKKQKIRVGLLNVQSGIGTTRGFYQYIFHLQKYLFPHNSKKISLLGKVAKDEEIDILATAEIDQGSSRTKGVDQVELLADTSELKHKVFFPTFVFGERVNQGNAIHSKYPIIDFEKCLLSGKGEPRCVGEAKIKVNDIVVSFFVTHLSLQALFRKVQIKELSERINRADTPIILAGDFNIAHEGELDLLEKSKLQKVYSAKTFPVWNPKRRLDYIFTSKEIFISKGRVVQKSISDHCLLIVDLEI